MERIEPEPLGLECPLFTDELVGRESLQRLEPPAEVVGHHEVSEVLPELVMAFVMVAPDSRVLDGPVHPLNLTIGPGVPGRWCKIATLGLGSAPVGRIGP